MGGSRLIAVCACLLAVAAVVPAPGDSRTSPTIAAYAVSIRGSIVNSGTVPPFVDEHGCTWSGGEYTNSTTFASRRAARVVVRRLGSRVVFRGARFSDVRGETRFTGTHDHRRYCPPPAPTTALHVDWVGGPHAFGPAELRFVTRGAALTVEALRGLPDGVAAVCFRATAPPNPLEFGDIEGDKDARSLFDARTRLLTVQASASAEASSESCELSRRIAWTLTFRRVS